MRLLTDKKGQIRVIEAFFASILLLSSLTLIPAAQNKSNDPTALFASTALNVLMSLDSDGHLAELVANQNWTAIQCCIQSVVPVTAWFNLTVFDENMTSLNDQLICSGSPVSDNIVTVEYVCACTSENFALYLLRLQLAVVD